MRRCDFGSHPFAGFLQPRARQVDWVREPNATPTVREVTAASAAAGLAASPWYLSGLMTGGAVSKTGNPAWSAQAAIEVDSRSREVLAADDEPDRRQELGRTTEPPHRD